MSLGRELRERISGIVQSDRVVLFMKGDHQAPQCGFSATVIGLLDKLLTDYTTVDVLADPEIREGLKEYSDWPTIPQLYVDQEFIGGCDIVQEMAQAGELRRTLGIPAPSTDPPRIEITEEAAAIIQEAHKGRESSNLHLGIDARFHNSLHFGPREAGDLEVQSRGIILLIDPDSASRAAGSTLHVVSGAQGPQLALANPQAPSDVRPMSVQELKRLIDAKEKFELIDMRPPEEREKARIEGARPLDEATRASLESQDRQIRLIFHCHHGARSLAAAEHYVELGFREVYSLSGGIDAWSSEIDPSVPRY